MFEIGFSPLTLLGSAIDDIKRARRRYLAITNVIEFSMFRLESFLTKEAKIRHKDCVRHRKQVYTLLDMIDNKDFENMLHDSTFQKFLACICHEKGVNLVSSVIHLLDSP